MSKYIVKAALNPVGGGNPEFTPDKLLSNGVEVDGFLLCAFKNGNPYATSLMGCTVMDVATLFAGDKSEAGSVIRQAMAIAEGLLKAEEIKKTEDRNTMARNLAEILRSK